MSHRLMMVTVATAALIAGAGLANAQGMGGGREGGAAGGAGMQQSAPSSPSGGAANREAPAGGMKASQSEEKGGAATRSAQETKQPAGEKAVTEKSAQETTKSDRAKGMKAEDHERNGNMKAEGQERNGNMKAEGREERNGNQAESHERRDNNTAAKEGERRTTGQAGAGAKLSSEQRTKITTVIRDQHVAPVTNVNFSISVGARVPREIGFHPLPAEIVTIYPEWRGYEFFLVRDEIVVVDPRTLEIVDVFPA